MEGNDERSFKEKVEDFTNMQRKVLITFPINVLRKFDDYCKSSSGDCYWLGIEQLLTFKDESNNRDFKTQMLIDRDDANFKILSTRVEELERNINTLTETLKTNEKEKSKPKTFGGKE